MHIRFLFLFVSIFLLFLQSTGVFASDWKKIQDPETLKKIYTDTTLRGINYPQSNLDYNQLNTEWQIEYCSDGTGILTFMGHTYPRTWKIKGNDQICITVRSEEKCHFYEEHTKYLDVYRMGVVGKRNAPWVFTVRRQKPEICK